ncbi:hypothetical protein COCSUDRAFT_34563 [Coccomyxa subellipsoidea C-169]|uniref:Uncharacterized protein n=1 Tax=Coccomyxa subellipsoidea (strain C-169) TaxID=574566 RepID=I0YJ42_COCSC|nr:hypothetical protein COCSUDRAFT_34563 [Coccomyxa subellipsoidea C-169]EIE18411.1 hypothetical protein COCSUDRAFT_34563 [Coccomyxa subellipsoidea C-169]|eukprot:XP_005642955.1 hypothetical protein COCSUDRAFT_34563 [Coccomyxa subellipsoidea C-169]
MAASLMGEQRCKLKIQLSGKLEFVQMNCSWKQVYHRPASCDIFSGVRLPIGWLGLSLYLFI